MKQKNKREGEQKREQNRHCLRGRGSEENERRIKSKRKEGEE